MNVLFLTMRIAVGITAIGAAIILLAIVAPTVLIVAWSLFVLLFISFSFAVLINEAKQGQVVDSQFFWAGDSYFDECFGYQMPCPDSQTKVRVVGNIHENPDLIGRS